MKFSVLAIILVHLCFVFLVNMRAIYSQPCVVMSLCITSASMYHSSKCFVSRTGTTILFLVTYKVQY